jgi:hypothetical protein
MPTLNLKKSIFPSFSIINIERLLIVNFKKRRNLNYNLLNLYIDAYLTPFPAKLNIYEHSNFIKL